VPSATTPTVLNAALPIAFKVSLLSGWIAGFATAILPAQADVPSLSPTQPQPPDDESKLDGTVARKTTRRTLI
jgi:hypothetical protein